MLATLLGTRVSEAPEYDSTFMPVCFEAPGKRNLSRQYHCADALNRERNARMEESSQ